MVAGEPTHKVWLGPALEILVAGLTVMLTLETDEEHGKFEMVHAKIVVPTANPVILVVGDKELVIVPLPEINDHVPTPAVGLFAAIVAVGVLAQTV